MLKEFGRRLAGGLVAAAMVAVACGIVLVAAAFAAYAGLKTWVSPAAAAALTALGFAAVAGLVALVAPALLRGGTGARSKRAQAAPEALHTVSQVAVAALGLLGDTVLHRSAKTGASKRRR